MHRQLALPTCLAVLLLAWPRPCAAWWEGGHHIVAVMAFDLLSDQQQQELLALLAEHPRFAEDFTPPENLPPESHDRWRVGVAGYWPDIARGDREFDRPTWHYQLGATLVVGDESEVQVPETPGPLPESATLKTRRLYIAQAVELCRTVLADPEQPAADRALAICWLAHLVGDAHQPCHAGSLYAAGAFPEGDRGANSIPVKQRDNLHALWDSLLGARYDRADIRRRIREIRSDRERMAQAAAAASVRDGLDPHTWLAESRKLGAYAVYSPEIREAVTALSRGFVPEIATTDLSEAYLQRAGSIARLRAAEAAHRLAALWRADLSGGEPGAGERHSVTE